MKLTQDQYDALIRAEMKDLKWVVRDLSFTDDTLDPDDYDSMYKLAKDIVDRRYPDGVR